jgi:hypothetical protein
VNRLERLREFRFGSRSVAFALLFLIIVAYGIYILWMGFYWDDWPWMFFSNVIGPQSLVGIEVHRPLSGLFLWLGAELIGETPLYWQIFALLLRFLSGLALWWVIVSIWPRRIERATWIAFIFLLYPGFTQQFVAVNSSRHLFALVIFFISLGLMVWSIRKPKWYWSFTVLSLLLSLIGTFTSEYFYGLELLRPFVIWLVLDFGFRTRLVRLLTILKYWIPYSVILIIVFIWRFIVSQKANYRMALIDTIVTTPIETLVKSVHTAMIDFFLVTLAAWSKIFSFPSPEEVGVRVTIYYWLIVLVCAFLVFVYFFKFRRDDYNRSWGKEVICLGIISLVIGGLPFWVTDIDIKLVFPADRTTLPMSFGVSLLLIGLLDLFIRPRLVKVILLSILVGLGIGYHFQTALSFRIDWIHQVSFLRQLSWRIPGLEEGTALLTMELPTRSTDNSLTAPINWIYAEDIDDTSLPYHLLFLDLRLGTSLPELKEGLPLTYSFRTLKFEGSLDNTLVVYYKDSDCVRVIHPDYDSYHPQFPELIADATPFSNLDQIVLKPEKNISLPANIFGPEPEQSWCYYFEKADLARQMGDWQQVAALGEAAFNSSESPNNVSELVPFIQGYAFTGKWEKAVKLTKETSRIDPYMKPMLCSIWKDIAINTEPSDERENAVHHILDFMNCPEL